MSIYIPYFYIIRHIYSGKMYAGSRYAKGCNPDELLKEDGYKTSSDKIKRIINQEGLDSFEILRIDTYCDDLHPYNYETLFLETNDCAGSDNWINKHNNSGMSFGLNEFYEKSKETLIEKYGVDHNSKIPGIVEKRKITYKEKTGYEYPFKNPTCISKTKQIKLEKYGDENYRNEEKIKESLIKKYGVDSWAKTEEGIENSKKIMEYINSTEHICEWCNRTIIGPNYKRWHGDNCKLNPNRNIKKLERFECSYCKHSYTKNILIQFHEENCKLNPNKINRHKQKQRSKKVCEKCNCEIDSSNFLRHKNKCKGC